MFERMKSLISPKPSTDLAPLPRDAAEATAQVEAARTRLLKMIERRDAVHDMLNRTLEDRNR